MINKIRCALVRKLRDLSHWLGKIYDEIGKSYIYPGMSKKDFNKYVKYQKKASEARQMVGEFNMFLIEHK